MMQMKQNGKIGPLKYGPPPEAKSGFTVGASSFGFATSMAATSKMTVPIFKKLDR